VRRGPSAARIFLGHDEHVPVAKRRNPRGGGDLSFSMAARPSPDWISGTPARARIVAGVRLVISDAHEGLKAAIGAVLLGAPRGSDAGSTFCATSSPEPREQRRGGRRRDPDDLIQPDAGAMREQLDEKLEPRFPVVAAMLAEAKEDVIAFGAFPVSHWRKICSTNPIERVNKEIERRIVGIFPDKTAVLPLTGAVPLEVNDEWAIAERRVSLRGLDGQA
jgi:putative transposase